MKKAALTLLLFCTLAGCKKKDHYQEETISRSYEQPVPVVHEAPRYEVKQTQPSRIPDAFLFDDKKD